MNFNIRKANESDRISVGELFKEMFDFHGKRDPHFTRTESGHDFFSDWFVGLIEDESALPLVAEHNCKVVGYALGIVSKHPRVFADRNYGKINDIAVSSAYRRHGIGQALFNNLQDWFSSKGIRRIELRVATTNEVSSAFWRKIGFEPYIETLVLKKSEHSA